MIDSKALVDAALPSREQALQFALMVAGGFPTVDALQYFYPDLSDPAELRLTHDQWVKSRVVKQALNTVQGKPWSDMSLDEKIQFSVNKHYAELAYFLYANNYSDLNGPERSKADVCRTALEAKLAGSAGKMDPLMSWFSDIKTGKIKLPSLPLAQTSGVSN